MRSGLILFALSFGGALFAQDDAVVTEFKAPAFPTRGYFKMQFEYAPRYELKPPVHLSDYVVSGKLELSLRSYLDLVMSNNTDVQIQKVSLEIPKNAIMRSFS